MIYKGFDMEHRTAKIFNLILGVTSLGLEIYAYTKAVEHGRFFVEEIFLATVIVFLLEAIISLIWCNEMQRNSRLDVITRSLGCISLCILGGLLIYSAQDIENSERCNISSCHEYMVKLAAGFIAIINGVVYLTPKRKMVPQSIIYAQSPNQHIIYVVPGYQYPHRQGNQPTTYYG